MPRRPEHPRADAGRAVPARRRAVPASRAARDRRTSARRAAAVDLTGVPRPDPGRRSRAPTGGGPCERATIAEGDVLVVRGDAETVARLHGRQGPRLPGGGAGRRRRGRALQPRVRPGGGRHPAPVRAARAEAVFPGMVTESGDLIILAVQRRGEDQGPKRDGARRRRHAAAPGNLEGARRAPRRPRTCSSSTRRSWSVARPSPWARGRSRPSPCCSAWSSCSPPARCRRSSRGCSRPAPWSCSGCSRSSRPTAPSTGRRSSWSAR